MTTSAIGPIVQLSPAETAELVAALQVVAERGGAALVAIDSDGFRVKRGAVGIWTRPMGIIHAATFPSGAAEVTS